MCGSQSVLTRLLLFLLSQDIINRRKMAENGINLALIEERDGESSEKVAIKLPGTRQGDMSLRAFRPEVRVTSLTFSPTGNFCLFVTCKSLN